MKAPSLFLCGGLLAASLVTAAPLEDQPVFVLKWGGVGGSAPGLFAEPLGLATDLDGNLYVADQFNQRVQKFTGDGVFIRQWGTNGSGPGQFAAPAGIAVSAAGMVYVTDRYLNRVQVFTLDGSFITTWGGGAGKGFREPGGVAVDPSGDVYIADTGNDRIVKFTSSGSFHLSWGTAGTGPGQFSYPIGIASDTDGYIFVADVANSRIQKFTSEGTYLAEWRTGCYYISIDATGSVYATVGDHLARKFSPSGELLTEWGSWGTGDGQFQHPSGIALDSDGHIFVAETAIGVGSIQYIQKFRQLSTAAKRTSWGSVKHRFR